MKAKLYRTVSVRERIPTETGYYHSIGKHGSKRVLWFDVETGFCEPGSHWMEEVELPSEEEIKKESDKGWVRSHFQAGASFILNHIKGCENGKN